jgi:hypothetical protein
MEGILKMRVSHRKYGGQEGAAQTSDLFYISKMERRITSALFCEYFRFKQNSHGYGTSGQTTLRFKTVCGGLCSAATPK